MSTFSITKKKVRSMSTETVILDSEKVNVIYEKCCLKADENTKNPVEVDGISSIVEFDPDRLENHKREIEDMLDELSDDFKRSGGGGASFLIACYDKHDRQWTSLHLDMDRLFQLGMATGKAKYCFPRVMWKSLTGEMPYFIIED